MPNPFKDWARMYGANKQYLESQGRPSSFFGQIGDIPRLPFQMLAVGAGRGADHLAIDQQIEARLARMISAAD